MNIYCSSTFGSRHTSLITATIYEQEASQKRSLLIFHSTPCC